MTHWGVTVNPLFINITYRYESRSRQGDYFPRPIVGLEALLSRVAPASLRILLLRQCATATFEHPGWILEWLTAVS